VTDTYCDEHDLPELVVYDGEDDDDPWELGCPICNYEEYQERQRKKGLEVLDGIGPKTAEKLEDAGIDDVGDLSEAEPETVADEVAGVSADSVREWQAKADCGLSDFCAPAGRAVRRPVVEARGAEAALELRGGAGRQPLAERADSVPCFAHTTRFTIDVFRKAPNRGLESTKRPLTIHDSNGCSVVREKSGRSNNIIKQRTPAQMPSVVTYWRYVCWPARARRSG